MRHEQGMKHVYSTEKATRIGVMAQRQQINTLEAEECESRRIYSARRAI